MKKIAIIGATGFSMQSEDTSIQCFSWDKIGKIQNIKDFHQIIISLTCIETGKVDKEKIDWAAFLSLFSIETVTDILIHQGKIFILGDPGFQIPNTIEYEERTDTEIPFLTWTGLLYAWEGNPGTTIEREADYYDYEPYLKNFSNWKYSLRGLCVDTGLLQHDYRHQNLFKIKSSAPEVITSVFCHNRYGQSLAFAARITYKGRNSYDAYSLGEYVFLPSIPMGEEEGIHIVLREFYKVDIALPPPEWTQDFLLPDQKALEADIDSLNKRLQDAFEQYMEKQEELKCYREWLRLIYDRGKSFEEIVWRVLKELGGTIQEPEEGENKEDGWLRVEIDGTIHEAVLEIKSTKGSSFNEDGIKQLLEWRMRGVTLHDKEYKGIFIGTHSIEKPLDERVYGFPDKWEKNARLHQLAALTGEHLYTLFILHAEQKLDNQAFWKALFSTNGVFDMTPFTMVKADPVA